MIEEIEVLEEDVLSEEEEGGSVEEDHLEAEEEDSEVDHLWEGEELWEVEEEVEVSEEEEEDPLWVEETLLEEGEIEIIVIKDIILNNT